MVKRLLENSMKGSCKEPVKQNLRFKKESREKTIVCASNGKTMIVDSIAGLICKM